VEAQGIANTLLEEEPMYAVLSTSSKLSKKRRMSLSDLAQETVIIYPAQPRPSFADQVLGQFRAHGFPLDRTLETNGLQTAVGLVAAGVGVSLVPRSVQRLQRNDVIYRPIADAGIVSAVLMTTRVETPSADLHAFMKATTKAFGKSV
jgi:DNA-binding transcriptional LysR family regulator